MGKFFGGIKSVVTPRGLGTLLAIYVFLAAMEAVGYGPAATAARVRRGS